MSKSKWMTPRSGVLMRDSCIDAAANTWYTFLKVFSDGVYVGENLYEMIFHLREKCCEALSTV